MKDIHILLVEDNEVNQIVACTLLKKWGMTVTVAANGKLALEAIQSRKFHLVLMDLQMPEMDGYEATGHIRSCPDHYFQNIPIIAFTASSMISSRQAALAAGMNDFITKPLCVEELQQKINLFVNDEVAARPVLPDFDGLELRDQESKYELLSVMIQDLCILTDSLKEAISKSEPQRFLFACDQKETTLGMLNDVTLNQKIQSIKAKLCVAADSSLNNIAEDFCRWCAELVSMLSDEHAKCKTLAPVLK